MLRTAARLLVALSCVLAFGTVVAPNANADELTLPQIALCPAAPVADCVEGAPERIVSVDVNINPNCTTYGIAAGPYFAGGYLLQGFATWVQCKSSYDIVATANSVPAAPVTTQSLTLMSSTKPCLGASQCIASTAWASSGLAPVCSVNDGASYVAPTGKAVVYRAGSVYGAYCV